MNCFICHEALEENDVFSHCQVSDTKHQFIYFQTENTFSLGLSFDGKISYSLYHNIDGNYYFDISKLKFKSINSTRLCRFQIQPFELKDYEKVLSDLIDRSKNLIAFV